MRANRRLLIRGAAALAIAALALGLRLTVSGRLPAAYDEPVYYNVGQAYAGALRAGDWARIPHLDENYEHPALFKLLYGAVMAPQPPGGHAPVEPDLITDASTLSLLYDMRVLSAAFGALGVLVAAVANPLAGLFLAVHTYAIRFTGQAYLEALPMLASTVSVLAYVKSGRRLNGWLAVSAAALGVTAASKYAHSIAGVGIALDWLLHLAWRPSVEPEGAERAPAPRGWQRQFLAGLGLLVGWGVLALAAFYAANPALWPAPLERLGASLSLTVYRSGTELVEEQGGDVLALLRWLVVPVEGGQGAIVTPFDAATTALAAVGLARAWRERRVMVVWLAAALAFLMVWQARFPHYILITTVPLAFCAAAGVRQVVDWVRTPPPNPLPASREGEG